MLATQQELIWKCYLLKAWSDAARKASAEARKRLAAAKLAERTHRAIAELHWNKASLHATYAEHGIHISGPGVYAGPGTDPAGGDINPNRIAQQAHEHAAAAHDKAAGRYRDLQRQAREGVLTSRGRRGTPSTLVPGQEPPISSLRILPEDAVGPAKVASARAHAATKIAFKTSELASHHFLEDWVPSPETLKEYLRAGENLVRRRAKRGLFRIW